MSGNQQENKKIKEFEELMNNLDNNPLYMQIPSDPQPAEITEILAKNPTIIARIGTILAEMELHTNNKKLLIKKKNRELDGQKSNIRLKTISDYRNNLEVCLKNEMEKIKELMQTGYTRAEAKEIVKLYRPEKPREADLADKSEFLTRKFVKEEIEPLEAELLEIKKIYDDWKVKYDLFENNFKASQSIKGLIQKDRNHY